MLRPGSDQARWLLPFLLIVAGWYVERPGRKPGYGSRLTIVGGVIVFAAGLGLHPPRLGHRRHSSALERGRRARSARASSVATLTSLLAGPGAFVVLLGALVVGGLMLLFNLTLRGLLRRCHGGGRCWSAQSPRRARALAGSAAEAAARRNGTTASASPPARPARRTSSGPDPTAARRAGPADRADRRRSSTTSARDQQSVAAQPDGLERPRRSARRAAPLPGGAGRGQPRTAVAAPTMPTALESLNADRVWTMPGQSTSCEPRPSRRSAATGSTTSATSRIIEEKLLSFQIPATVVARRTPARS